MGDQERVEELDALLTHASNWFTYHAGQRLQSFNFFVVFDGALIVAVFQRWQAWSEIAALAGIGVLTAAAFYVLEVRNTELVKHGRDAIDTVANVWTSGSAAPPTMSWFPRHGDTNRTRVKKLATWWVLSDKEAKGPRLVTHRFVLRTLIAGAGISWLFLFVFALANTVQSVAR